MIGTLVKITAAKKLMMKISEQTYDSITARLTAECKKKNFSTDRIATFSLENDDGEENYFVMISLDKYDKQNMRKFEQLLKKDVTFQYRMKSYEFIPDGEEEQRCGINLELISIRQVKTSPAEMKLVHAFDTFVAKHGDKAKAVAKEAWDEYYNKEAIAARAAAQAINPAKELNAEEQAIDEDIEKKVAKRFMRELSPQEKITTKILQELEERQKIQKDDLLQDLAAPRRRRTTALEQQMKALEEAAE